MVFLGIGSNLGDKEKNIADAFFLLEKYFVFLETASLYISKPLYHKDQPDFINTVFRGIAPTGFTPSSLLKTALDIENRLGRKRDPFVPKGPRIIDIDILLFGQKRLNTETLVIPHPGIKERQFVLKPLLELENRLTDPLSLQEYLLFTDKQDNQGVYLYKSCRYIEKYKYTG
ncbi:MAG: 2-amino-4-hydroxy-6-hydroxymethyldihydropteridine diphosphokinase [Spirochaetia bacterium]|jgi:2-amino-4-hydroxy-6-hydroxymethyldihydropteridine diphosphokinase|nr:2-amino-4-hydroxy-6-hydroxymethyldihydropteridine diphosphokinase [Spirochaetia bacterium]